MMYLIEVILIFYSIFIAMKCSPNGPSFIPNHDVIVTVIEGQVAVLPCSVDNLNGYKVIWTDSWSTLLTFETRRILDDSRISVERPKLEEWNLRIRDVKYSDRGRYTCQINTNPVTTKHVELKVRGKNDPCKSVTCSFGAICESSKDHLSYRCICPTQCDNMDTLPVCGSDHVECASQCELRRASCNQMQEITLKDFGKCEAFKTTVLSGTSKREYESKTSTVPQRRSSKTTSESVVSAEQETSKSTVLLSTTKREDDTKMSTVPPMRSSNKTLIFPETVEQATSRSTVLLSTRKREDNTKASTVPPRHSSNKTLIFPETVEQSLRDTTEDNEWNRAESYTGINLSLFILTIVSLMWNMFYDS